MPRKLHRASPRRAQPHAQSTSPSSLTTRSLGLLLPGRKHEGRQNPAGRARGAPSCARVPVLPLPFPELCSSPSSPPWLRRERNDFWSWRKVQGKIRERLQGGCVRAHLRVVSGPCRVVAPLLPGFHIRSAVPESQNGLDGKGLKAHPVPAPFHGQRHFPPEQAAPSPIHPTKGRRSIIYFGTCSQTLSGGKRETQTPSDQGSIWKSAF